MVISHKTKEVKTASNAKAMQAVPYQNNKRIIVQHFGSAHYEQEIDELFLSARMDKGLCRSIIDFY